MKEIKKKRHKEVTSSLYDGVSLALESNHGNSGQQRSNWTKHRSKPAAMVTNFETATTQWQ